MPRLRPVLRGACWASLAVLAVLVVLDWLVVDDEDGDALLDDLRLTVALVGLVTGLAAIMLRRREGRSPR